MLMLRTLTQVCDRILTSGGRPPTGRGNTGEQKPKSQVYTPPLNFLELTFGRKRHLSKNTYLPVDEVCP